MVNKGKSSSLDQVVLLLVRSRLFLPLIFVFLIAIIGAAFFGISSLEKQHQQNTQCRAESIENYINNSDRILNSVARVAKDSTPEQTSIFMTGIWEPNWYFDTLYYVDDTHIIREMVPYEQRYRGQDITDLPYFNWTDNTKKLVISGPFKSLRTENLTVYLTQHLSSGGAIIGELNLGSLKRDISESGTSGSECIFILDKSGTLLTSPSEDQVRPQTSLENLEIFKRALTGDITLVYPYTGRWVLGSATQIKNTGWIVVCQTSLLVLLGPYVVVLILVCIISLVLWTALVMNLKKDLRKRVITPLIELSQTTASLAQGNFNHDRTRDASPAAFTELEQLQRDFQSMSDAIQDRQAALKESEDLFRTMAEYASVSICLVQDGKIIYVNPYTTEITGYSFEEMIRHPFSEFIHPQSQELVYAKEQEFLNDEPVMPFEVRVHTKSGEERWIEDSTALLKYRNKSAYITICVDITDQKKAEEELRESEATYRTLFENSGTAMMLINKDSTILMINTEFENLSGYVRTDIEGKKKWTEFVAKKEDLIRIQDYHHHRRIYSTTAPSQYEFPFTCIDNRIRNCIAIVSMIPGTEKSLVALLDITEQKQVKKALFDSEIRYMTLFQSASVAIFLYEENHFIDCNQETLRMFGIEDKSDFIGFSPLDFSPEYQPDGRSSREKYKENITIAMEGIPQRFLWKHLRQDGTPFDMEVSLNRSIFEEKTILIAFGIDITDRLQVGQELREKNTELNAAYEQLAATEEELRSNYRELLMNEQALRESEHKNAVLIDAIPDMMFIIASDGTYLDFHVPDESYLALPVDRIIDKNIYDTGLKKESADSIMNYIQKAVMTSRLQLFEYELMVPTGKRTYEARMMALDDKKVLVIVRDITERKKAELALSQATRKLNLLNQITFTDIQNGIFSLSGYLELEDEFLADEKFKKYHDKEVLILQAISDALLFANHFQNLGLQPPHWQSVIYAFLLGISHLNLSEISRNTQVEHLEIYADTLLEKVFFVLAENVKLHAKTATNITLRYEEIKEGLVLIFEDNGVGIPNDQKKLLCEEKRMRKKGMGLFLAKEILDITRITITETGVYGNGARFEMVIPAEGYRFVTDTDNHSKDTPFVSKE